MNVILPEKEKINKKRIVLYTLIVLICVIGIAIAVYQIFSDEKLDVILGLNKDISQEQYEELQAGFDDIFTNTVDIADTNTSQIVKIENEKDIVYTNYEVQKSSENNYNVNVHIPYININNETIKKYNEEIQQVFTQIAENTLATENRNIIYTVEYKACITNNILSVIIRSNLKQGSNAQRVIIQTYNYNLLENREIKITDLLQANGIDEKTAKNRIDAEVSKAQQQAQELNELGYNIYQRDLTSDIYSLENTTEFFTNGTNLYIIYAYGNETETSEMDLIIF